MPTTGESVHPAGSAVRGDAADADALGKLSRYETALSNHLQRLVRMLHDLQDGRLPAVEPDPEDSGPVPAAEEPPPSQA